MAYTSQLATISQESVLQLPGRSPTSQLRQFMTFGITGPLKRQLASIQAR
jgi:hypothetical protein